MPYHYDINRNDHHIDPMEPVVAYLKQKVLHELVMKALRNIGNIQFCDAIYAMDMILRRSVSGIIF